MKCEPKTAILKLPVLGPLEGSMRESSGSGEEYEEAEDEW
jgi:hypothetical protein